MQYSQYRSVLSLRKGKTHSAGRNSHGKITVRHRGGGHKQAVRFINWARSENQGLIVGFEYDPRRNAPLAKLYHKAASESTDTQASNTQHEYSYILAPAGVKLFQEVHSYVPNKLSLKPAISSVRDVAQDKVQSMGKLLQPGDKAPLAFFEPGDFIHAVEAFPGQGAIFGRSAGSFCQVRSIAQENLFFRDATKKRGGQAFAKVRLPSGSQRLINLQAMATFGTVSSTGILRENGLQKAGRSRWLGWRPSVRGVARNPVDHPHGGGQGKTSGGRPSVTFKSWPTKGQPTRSSKRHCAFILTPRQK